jgi:hypothetical protein
LHTVISATASTFTVNVLWSTIGESTANGNVAYADQRKIVVLNDSLITNKEVFNGAYSLGIYAAGSFPSAYYLGTTDPSYALTSLSSSPTNAATATQYTAYYLLMCRVYSGVVYTVNYYYTSNDVLFYGPINYTTSNGLWNFLVDMSSYPIEDFYVEITGTNGSVFKYYFQIDDRCVINYDTLLYLDRMGSWQSFAFQLKTYEKGQITREQYNQHIDGQVAGSQWSYGTIAMGFRTYNTNVSYSLDLNTNWMDQYDADRFQELLTSPQVYYMDYTGQSYACTVEATGFENFRQRNKNLIKQSVTIKLANQVPING